MAKKATTKPKKQKEEVLEDILFNCRNFLRGKASLTDKRDMLLTLVFLKFISERFHDKQAQIIAENADDPEMAEIFLKKKSAYAEDGIFMLDDITDWETLKLVAPNELAVALDDAISKLEESDKKLKNALPKGLFVDSGTDGNVLKKVIDEIDKIDHKKFKDKDLIGRVYEYFLQAFAINANKEDGEFYTPHSVVELIATLIEPFNGVLYDPCCGSGGMFIQCAKFVEQHGGNNLSVSVYGQESDPTTFRLAKMNLAVRGIEYNLGDKHDSTFTNDQHRGRTFDYIMANPPFNLKKWYSTELEHDARWAGYGLPPQGNANYAWILHILSKLNGGSGRAGFLLANGALNDEDAYNIRKQLIENDKIEAIIMLPHRMFYGPDISVTLWILNENKRACQCGKYRLRDRSGEILFMDLRQWKQIIYEKRYVKFSDSQITEIYKIYKQWQTGELVPACKDELYFSANIEQIREHDYTLLPFRYIHFVDKSKLGLPSLEESIKTASNSIDEVVSQQLSIIEDLKKIQVKLTSFLNFLAQDYPFVPLGESIESCDERNSDNSVTLSQGISNNKYFQTPKQVAENSKNDKIVRRGSFAYNKATTRNGEKISIAYRDEEDCTVSSSYQVFRIVDEQEWNPYYLMLWFKRPEFDRYARYRSYGSAHEYFEFDEMKRVSLPKPPIEVQNAIVEVFHCASKTKSLADFANAQMSIISSQLIKHLIP